MGGFVVLDKTEFSLKLKRLCQSQGMFYAWKRGEKQFPLVPHKVEDRGSGNIHLHFTAKTELTLAPGQELLFYFVQKSVQFFSSGNLVKNDEGWTLEILGQTFKREKRKNERLLTFPHQQVFVYFQVSKETPAGNVVFFDKTLEKKKSFLEKFLKRTDSQEGITGFRVLDISQNGFSFTASKAERNLFKEDERHQVQLHFNGYIFDLSEVKIVHACDYIDPRFGHVPMFKLGVEILKGDELLNEKIQAMLGEESKRVEISSEFENFFK